ncbi:Protein of unknown function DUF4505 [Trypanosoma melophagium]|uniref:Protein of unknown function DUF4505 n=1 Tax=Trypanosoma melophagium TaxID=715481 RepID=UPI00351A2719|nr:Protein of unknown function DUF4505 [Trypanosoma melophagium]
MTTARRYYYYLNERGHLFHVFDIKGFVKSTRRPSGPTYLRDGVFLDFFYQRLRRNNLAHIAPYINNSNRNSDNSGITTSITNNSHSSSVNKPGGILESILVDDDTMMTTNQFLQCFPYVSLCGKEKNFLSVQDAPVVFTDYNFNYGKDGECTGGILTFAGSLQEPFQPSALTVTKEGKLFHPITSLKLLYRTSAEEEVGEIVKGLVGAQVGLKLGFDFLCEEQDSDGQYIIEWNGKTHVIPYSDQ